MALKYTENLFDMQHFIRKVLIEDVELFKQMIIDNKTYSYIAYKFNISKPTVYSKCVELFNKTPKELRNDYK